MTKAEAVFIGSMGSDFCNGAVHGVLDDNCIKHYRTIYAWWMMQQILIRATVESARAATE